MYTIAKFLLKIMKVLEVKPVRVPQFPPQRSHGVSSNRTGASFLADQLPEPCYGHPMLPRSLYVSTLTIIFPYHLTLSSLEYRSLKFCSFNYGLYDRQIKFE